MSEAGVTKMEDVLATESTPNVEAESKKREELELKRKAAELESKRRSKRMFGLLQGTLNEAAKKQTHDSSGKRQEIERRLSLKLSSEKKELESQRAEKLQQLDLSKKEDELRSVDAIFDNRNETKLNLAYFLCTSFTIPSSTSSDDLLPPPTTTKLPHAMRSSQKPLYYLPYRLLRSQEDQIKEQISRTKKAVATAREEFAISKKARKTDSQVGDEKMEIDSEKVQVEEKVEEVEERYVSVSHTTEVISMEVEPTMEIEGEEAIEY